ncbi:MAG: YchJ family protein [Alcanivoracaceae bacterium]
MTTVCSCGSGRNAGECCEPLHRGQPAQTPEQLMRARYSAYVRHQDTFLMASWHPSTRPAELTHEPGLLWRHLDVSHSDHTDDTGSVHFSATWQQGERWGILQEKARFTREAGHWYYLDGDVSHLPLTPERNKDCPCGSGRKYKRCCRP